MKAANFIGDSKIKIINKDLRKLDKNEVLVKVAFCGLCGSESKFFKTGCFKKGYETIIPGHEISGIVVEKGSDTKIEIGKKVLIYINQYCGECKYCKNNLTNLCENSKGLIGWHKDGGYAEYIVVPENILMPLCDQIGLDTGVLLLDLIGTAYHGLRFAKIDKEVKKALVIGSGPVGLGVISILKMGYRISDVYAVDVIPYRLDIAKKLGAIPINVSERNLDEFIEEEIGCDFNLVVEVVGNSITIEQAMKNVKPGGKIVLLGEPKESFTINRDTKWTLKDFSMLRTFYFPISEFEENKKFFITNKDKLKGLISNIYPLEEINHAFNEFYKGNSGKILIKC